MLLFREHAADTLSGKMPDGNLLESSHRTKCRAVAWVDLILSCLILTLSIIMLVNVLTTGTNSEIITGMRLDVVCATRIAAELFSIMLTVKLLLSTNHTAVHHAPDVAAKWCTTWLIGCCIWIFELGVGVLIKVLEPNLTSKTHYLEVSLLCFVIVLRLGAVNVVLKYVKELKTCSQRQYIN